MKTKTITLNAKTSLDKSDPNVYRSIVSELARCMAAEMDYYDHLRFKPYEPSLDGPAVNKWCNATIPDCAFINGVLYYKNDADLILFRLKWL